MYRRFSRLRWLVVLTSLAAWFAASNHCAVSAALTINPSCPAHAQEHDHSPQPQDNGCDDLECCKNLQATTAVSAGPVTKPVWIAAWQPFVAPLITIIEAPFRQPFPVRDNGPPGNSFSVLVLQRSLLAHAPPAL